MIQGNLKLVNALLKAGEDLHQKDALGLTALDHAKHAALRARNNPELYKQFNNIKELLEATIYLRENIQ